MPVTLNGTGPIVFDSSGNVGIGTNSPSYKLDVKDGAIRVYNSAGTDADLRFANNASTAGKITYTSQDMAFFTAGSERMRITSSGGVSFGSSGTAYGTSGQVLQSNGNAAPSWTTISATGALIRAPQILTSGTSYTTPSNCTKIYVEAWGGGGNGGSAMGSSAYQSAGGGGGAGAYCAKYFTVTGSTAYTYAIGAAGGNTTFTVSATTITAGAGASSSGAPTAGVSSGAAGGTATNGDINARGASGTTGFLATGGANNKLNAIGGAGGSSAIGGGGIASINIGGNGAGGAAVGYASGGAGAVSSDASTQNGGSGTQGVIRIWEFT